MKIPFTCLLAWRLIPFRTAPYALTTLTRICFIAIAVSAGALTLSSALMRGFHTHTLNALQGMSPDLTLKTPHQYLDAEKIGSILTNEFRAEVATYSPLSFQRALVQHPLHTDELTSIITLIVVDPQKAAPFFPFPHASERTTPQPTVATLTATQILIGASLAEQLNVQTGETIVMRYAEGITGDTGLCLATAYFTIAGIFTTGLEEWDQSIGVITFPGAADLFPGGQLVQQIALKLTPNQDREAVQKKLNERFHLPLSSWYDLNPALVDAMQLEQRALMFILGLIIFMATMTTIALLSLQLVHHRKTIALLYAYGMSRAQLVRIFMLSGVSLSMCATGVGVLGAIGMSILINRYKLISLPASVYYSSSLEAHLSVPLIMSVLGIFLLVSLCATALPARRIIRMPLVTLLHERGS